VLETETIKKNLYTAMIKDNKVLIPLFFEKFKVKSMDLYNYIEECVVNDGAPEEILLNFANDLKMDYDMTTEIIEKYNKL